MAPGGLAQRRDRRREAARERAGRGLHTLGLEQPGEELAEHDRVTVGDEVGLAGTPARRAPDQALDGVVHVRDRGQVASTADPGEAPAAHQLDDRRQQRGVAPRPRRSGGAPRPSRSRRGWRPGRPARHGPWWRCTAPASRDAGARSHRRSPAAVPPSGRPRCRHARSGAHPRPRSHAARFRSRSRCPRSNSSGVPQSPSVAAAWKATSHPSAPARIADSSASEPSTGSAPRSRTARAAASERASARTEWPSP